MKESAYMAERESGKPLYQGRICAAVAAADMGQALELAQACESLADVIEIRLDGLRAPRVEHFIETIRKPLLFTNRPVWEGGAYAGSEKSRLKPLLAAVEAGAAYVDLEFRADSVVRNQLVEQIRNFSSMTLMILSWHDFTGTPSSAELERIFLDMHSSGAQVGKIVTMARSFHDVERILSLQELSFARDFPLISFCMGEQGRLSRVVTLQRGGYMTYAAPDQGEATAPGQLTLTELVACLAESSQ